MALSYVAQRGVTTELSADTLHLVLPDGAAAGSILFVPMQFMSRAFPNFSFTLLSTASDGFLSRRSFHNHTGIQNPTYQGAFQWLHWLVVPEDLPDNSWIDFEFFYGSGAPSPHSLGDPMDVMGLAHAFEFSADLSGFGEVSADETYAGANVFAMSSDAFGGRTSSGNANNVTFNEDSSITTSADDCLLLGQVATGGAQGDQAFSMPAGYTALDDEFLSSGGQAFENAVNLMPNLHSYPFYRIAGAAGASSYTDFASNPAFPDGRAWAAYMFPLMELPGGAVQEGWGVIL